MLKELCIFFLCLLSGLFAAIIFKLSAKYSKNIGFPALAALDFSAALVSVILFGTTAIFLYDGIYMPFMFFGYLLGILLPSAIFGIRYVSFPKKENDRKNSKNLKAEKILKKQKPAKIKDKASRIKGA